MAGEGESTDGVPASAELVRRWSRLATESLIAARSRIDALNVFPVPDGDTGTNLSLTLESATAAAVEAPDALHAAARALVRGALLGARGNSGVIMSQLLRGACSALEEQPSDRPLAPAALAAMLRRAADLGYAAVEHPREGTILSVARAAAVSADSAASSGAATTVVADAMVQGARAALAATTDQLEELRRAGVVDAGGSGLVIVLECLAAAVSGRSPIVEGDATPVSTMLIDSIGEQASHHYGGPAYEVMFLLDAPDASIPVLRTALDALGDSLVVVGGDGTWNVHVHVDDAGAAIELALQAGRPFDIRITHLEPVVDRDRRVDGRRLVAVTHGPGVQALLEGIGVECVPARANTRPATSELIAAIERTRASEVIVLPSDKDSRAVAELAAEQARADGQRISVIPTRSIVQTLAAVAVHDGSLRFSDDVVGMTRAAGATRYAAVTVAARAALTTVGPCAPGDVLGLVDGDIVLVGSDVDEVAEEILRRMLAIGGELVTLVLGQEAGPGLREALPEWIESTFPLIDVVVHDGGQPLWPIIMGVE